MTIENLTSRERFKLNAGYRNGWTFDFYTADDRALGDRLEKRGLIEYVRGRTAAITPRGREALDYLDSKKAEEKKIWDSLLATVAKFLEAADVSGTSRTPGDYLHHEDGTIQGRTFLTLYNGDGTRARHEIIATLRNGRIATDVLTTEDSYDYKWQEGGEKDQETAQERARQIIVDHVVYTIRPDEPGNRYAGHGGRRFEIEYLEDGRRIVSRNLWRGSTVPPKWRERWPDTARFVEPEQTKSLGERLGLTPLES
jgi:hypothetical protein